MTYEYAEGMVRLALHLFPHELFEVQTDAETKESYILHTHKTTEGKTVVERYDRHEQMQYGCGLTLGVMMEQQHSDDLVAQKRICEECVAVKPQS